MATLPLLAANEVKQAEQAARAYLAARNPNPDVELQLRLDDRYEHLSKSKEKLPEGATLRFRGAQGGGGFVVSMRKQKGQWNVDTRWWEALGRLVDGAVPQKGEPESAIKSALLLMLDDDREKLAEFFVRDTRIDTLFPSNYSPANLGHFFELVREMPVVEVSLDELVMGPEGNYIRVGDLPGSPERVFIGQYGVIDLVFRMRKENGAWKLLPAW